MKQSDLAAQDMSCTSGNNKELEKNRLLLNTNLVHTTGNTWKGSDISLIYMTSTALTFELVCVRKNICLY